MTTTIKTIHEDEEDTTPYQIEEVINIRVIEAYAWQTPIA